MTSGAVFKSNTSQAVRLPKAVALPESVKRVDIIALGQIGRASCRERVFRAV